MKTLSAAMKQKFLTHPTQVVEQDINTVKTNVEVAVTKVENTAETVVTDVKQGL